LSLGSEPVELLTLQTSSKVDVGKGATDFLKLRRSVRDGVEEWTSNASASGDNALYATGDYVLALRPFDPDEPDNDAFFTASVVTSSFLVSYYLTTFLARRGSIREPKAAGTAATLAEPIAPNLAFGIAVPVA
jgi:hypothetical protein